MTNSTNEIIKMNSGNKVTTKKSDKNSYFAFGMLFFISLTFFILLLKESEHIGVGSLGLIVPLALTFVGMLIGLIGLSISVIFSNNSFKNSRQQNNSLFSKIIKSFFAIIAGGAIYFVSIILLLYFSISENTIFISTFLSFLVTILLLYSIFRKNNA